MAVGCTAKNARASIRKISKEDKSYRRLIAMRMYFRAKYHKNQTPGMREAMKVWKKYMDNLDQRTFQTGTFLFLDPLGI